MRAGSEITVVNYDYDVTNALVTSDGASLVVFRDDLEKREEPLD